MPLDRGLYRTAPGRPWLYQFKWRGHVYKGSTGLKSKVDAREWLDAYREQISKAEVGIGQAEEVPTLQKVLELWEAAKGSQVAPLYVTNMRAAVLTHAEAHLRLRLDALDNRVAEEIRSTYMATKGRGYRKGQDWEAEREHTAGGANSLMRRLSALCGWAVEMGYIKARPFKLATLKGQEEARGVVWPEKVQAFLAEADKGGRKSQAKKPEHKGIPQSSTAIRLMLGCGLREDEAVHMGWDWMDWRRAVLVVMAAKDRGVREVPVPPWLVQHLRGLWSAAGEPTEGLVLPAGKGQPHHKNFTQKPVARVCTKLGITGVTPHRLRATFASAHWEAGTPLSQIQQMMGHESPETTWGYIVTRPKDQAQAQAKVAELMGFVEVPVGLPEKSKQPKQVKKK